MTNDDRKAIELNPAMRYKRDIQGHCDAYTFDEQAALKAEGRIDELVQSMLPMAMRIASDVRQDYNRGANKGGYEWDDLETLIAVANEALLKAIKAWDPDKGSKASTYVYQSVRRDVVRYLYKELSTRAGHLSMEQDIELYDDSEIMAQDLAHVSNIPSPQHTVEVDSDLDYLRQQIGQLTPLQRDAVRLYLYSPACEGNYAAVGLVMGITRQAAKQLIERAFTSLQERCNISVGDSHNANG